MQQLLHTNFKIIVSERYRPRNKHYRNITCKHHTYKEKFLDQEPKIWVLVDKKHASARATTRYIYYGASIQKARAFCVSFELLGNEHFRNVHFITTTLEDL